MTRRRCELPAVRQDSAQHVAQFRLDEWIELRFVQSANSRYDAFFDTPLFANAQNKDFAKCAE